MKIDTLKTRYYSIFFKKREFRKLILFLFSFILIISHFLYSFFLTYWCFSQIVCTEHNDNEGYSILFRKHMGQESTDICIKMKITKSDHTSHLCLSHSQDIPHAVPLPLLQSASIFPFIFFIFLKSVEVASSSDYHNSIDLRNDYFQLRS